MNTITDLANTTWSGAITEAWNILGGPIGYVIIFFLGLTILSAVVFTIKKFVSSK